MRISKLLTNPKTKEKFLQKYTQLFGKSITRLEKQYPNLTSDDLLYIALFSLNLNSQQVADLLHIKVQSVWNRR